jgi:predicted amidohydrolase
MRAAVVQMNVQVIQSQVNLTRMIGFLEQASTQGASLVVFPECSLQGYTLSAAEASAHAEAIPGPGTAALAAACRRLDLHAVVGMIETDADGINYNSAALLGPDGVIGVYRKTHLPYLGVDRFLACGDDLHTVFPTAVGKLGILICYDLRLPEPARLLALAGAQLIVVSTAWPEKARLYSDHIARTRAAENGVFLAAANRTGEERGVRYLGHSLIIGPDGEVLAEAGGEEETLLVADLDLARADDKRRIFIPEEYELHLMADRRPDLYAPLSASTP